MTAVVGVRGVGVLVMIMLAGGVGCASESDAGGPTASKPPVSVTPPPGAGPVAGAPAPGPAMPEMPQPANPQPEAMMPTPAPTPMVTGPEPAAAASFADVQQVFAGACSFRGCHGGGSSSGMLELETAAYDALVNVPSPMTSLTRVVPGDPDGSYLYQKLTQDMPAAGARMPLGQPLDAERTDTIRSWIAAGAAP